MILLNIPSHQKCTNCGGCCGPVPVSKDEAEQIKKYITNTNPKIGKGNFLNCKFRVDGKCSIYPVRPIMCKLFGVTKGMSCTNGNTKEIDGRKFLEGYKSIGLLNNVIKAKPTDGK